MLAGLCAADAQVAVQPTGGHDHDDVDVTAAEGVIQVCDPVTTEVLPGLACQLLFQVDDTDQLGAVGLGDQLRPVAAHAQTDHGKPDHQSSPLRNWAM